MSGDKELQTLLQAYLSAHPGKERDLAERWRTAIGTITRWANGKSKPAEAIQKVVIADLKKISEGQL